jgi:hypothetical protein
MAPGLLQLDFPADGTASLANGEIIRCLVPEPSTAAFSGATQRANAVVIARYFADLDRESLQRWTVCWSELNSNSRTT